MIGVREPFYYAAV